MKKKDITVGGHYLMKVSGVVTTVRVDSIKEGSSGPYKTIYSCMNLKTGKKCQAHSASKFRGVARPDQLDDLNAADREAVCQDCGTENTVETEQRPDPTAKSVYGKSAVRTTSLPTTASVSKTPMTPTATAPILSPAAAPVPSALASKFAAKMAQAEQTAAPHLVIVARAGTGKTTTLVEGLKVLRGIETRITPSPQQQAIWDALCQGVPPRSVCFCAFNSAIAAELKKRVPPGCDAKTMHGLGFSAVRKTFDLLPGDQGINKWRTHDLLARLLQVNPKDLKRERPVVYGAVPELVGLCKMNLLDGADAKELAGLARYYDVDLEDDNGRDYADEILPLVPQMLAMCKDVEKDRCIDFNDMIWLPVVLDLPIYRYELLLVDEAQDLNRCQQALAKKSGKRLVLCGDPKQAIYGFAGADADSIPRMIHELSNEPSSEPDHDPMCPAPHGPGCQVLPLTVTRRCGKTIVEEAHQLVPDFEAHESNGPGKVSSSWYSDRDEDGRLIQGRVTYHSQVQPGDMILCRVNAPLVNQCFHFLKQGRKAAIQGRDVAAKISKLVDKVVKRTRQNDPPMRDFLEQLNEWHFEEMEKEQARRHPNDEYLQTLGDLLACVLCFAEGAGDVPGIHTKINSIFTDDKQMPGIRLSSIHKAKGLEAKRVFFVNRDKMACPSPWAKDGWQRDQENNLLYVGITRAIEELIYVR